MNPSAAIYAVRWLIKDTFRQALATGDRKNLKALLLQGKQVRDSLPGRVKKGTTDDTDNTVKEDKR